MSLYTNLENEFDYYPFEESEKNKKNNGSIPSINTSVLNKITNQAFSTLSFTFTKEHIENVIKAFNRSDATENDKYVCASILKNAQIAAEKKFALCQDTGIANIYGWNNGLLLNSTVGKDAFTNIYEGAKDAYDKNNLRFSTSCAQNFYDEKDPKNNMPPQVAVFDSSASLAPLPSFMESFVNEGKPALGMIFCAKGGGSSNKTSFVQGTKAYLNPEKIRSFLKEQISHLGTSACPPYTLAFVAGGLSPEQNTLTLKLASAGAYDKMTTEPNPYGFRDKEIEKLMLQIAEETGYGAQFGGKCFALDAIAIRLPRHGASCPLSVGVSCSAHRNLKAVVTPDGFYLEKTAAEPQKIKGFNEAVEYLNSSGQAPSDSSNSAQKNFVVNTNDGIATILQQLQDAKCGDRISLSGKILVARDAAHARWQKLIESGKDLPEYTKQYPICYAGPARTPQGSVIGSFGPTTAGRMDVYAESLMSRGAALVTLAKGNRSRMWQDACKKYNAFYLGTPGGIAALIASSYILDQKIVDYEDLGMEAVRLITVKDLPCFVLTDKDGNDFYSNCGQ